MNVETISSRQNPLMTHLRKLGSSRSYRVKSGEYLCDGTKLLAEALKWGAEVKTAVFSEGINIPPLPQGVRAVRVSGELMRSVSPMETPQGALFTVALPEVRLPETLKGRHYLVLDGVQDPGNMGTILRSADAMGACGVLLGPGCADPWSPKSIRSAMGSTFHVPVVETADLCASLRAMKEAGYLLLAGHLRGESTLPARIGDRAALLIGSEGHGLSDAVSAEATLLYRLPMKGRAESLNAAVCAGILLYELSGRMEE